jgi:hypothetical protein
MLFPLAQRVEAAAFLMSVFSSRFRAERVCKKVGNND